MEGDSGHEMFIVLAGSVLLYQIVAKKMREETDVTFGQTVREIATVREGDFFGEMAVLDGLPRSTCAVALTDIDVLVLEDENFGQVLATRPEFALRLMREMSRRVRELDAILKNQGLANR